MPIEDIQHLKTHSVKERILILIDSNERDKTRWHSPNDFEIQFVEPFKNVIGVEILNASIPRSSFMVDTHCNELSIICGYDSLTTKYVTTIKLTNRNYDIVEKFFEDITNKLNVLNDSIEDNETSLDPSSDVGVETYDGFIVTMDNDEIDDLIKHRAIMRIRTMKPFVLDMSRSTSKHILGFDEYTNLKELDEPTPRYIPLDTLLYNDNNYVEYTDGDIPHYDDPLIFEKETIFSFTGNHNFEKQIIITEHDNPPHIENSVIQTTYLIKEIEIIFIQDDELRCTHNKPFVISSNVINLPILLKKTNIDDVNKSFNIKIVYEYDKREYIFNKSVEFVYKYENFRGNIEFNTYNDYQKYYVNKIIVQNDHNILQTQDFTSKKTDRNDIKTFTNKTSHSIDVLLSGHTNKYADNSINLLLFEERESNLELNVKIEYNYVSNIRKHDFKNSRQVFCSKTTFGTIGSQVSQSFMNNEHLEKQILYIKFQVTDLTLENNEYWFYLSDTSDNTKKYFKCKRIDDFFEYNIEENTNSGNPYYNPFRMLYFKDNTKIYLDGNELTYTINHINYVDTSHPVNTVSYEITSPGVINLAADNYVILRCDEIENHMQGSYLANRTSPGLGILNINFEGYTSTNMNFISLSQKEFHPIGKLSKLRFRFERRYTNELYDFKGANVSFVLSIKYLQAQSDIKEFNTYILNPEYMPNLQEYNSIYDNNSVNDDSLSSSNSEESDDDSDSSNVSTTYSD